MSEHIKVDDPRFWDSLVGWALLRAMTNKASSNAVEVFNVVPGKVELDVSLTINGIEVSLKDALDIWKEERDRLVRRDAIHLIKNRMNTVLTKMRIIEKEMVSVIKREFPDLYVDGDGEQDALELDLPIEFGSDDKE